jgi:hypothetical protein
MRKPLKIRGFVGVLFIGFGGRFPAMGTGSKNHMATRLLNSTRPIGNRPQVGNPRPQFFI